MKPRIPQSEIYETSIRIFAEYGYEKTRISDIAKSLSVTKGNLYLYSEGKKDMYESSIRYGLKKWLASTAAAAEQSQSADEKFTALCCSAFGYLKQERNLRKILQQDQSIFPINSEDDRFADINREAINLLADTIREGIDEGIFRDTPPEQTARYIFSVYIMFIIRTYVQDDSTADESLFKTAVEMNLNGLLMHQHRQALL